MFHQERIVIGITGGSASGKTLIAHKIAKFLEEKNKEVTLVSQDHFYKSVPHGTDISTYNFDDPNALDLDELHQAVSILKYGRNVLIPTYNFKIHQRDGQQEIKTARIIIVEGIFVFNNSRLRDLFDLKIFVDASSEVRLLRRIERDIAERGRDISSIKKQYLAFVKPAYRTYIKSTKQYADITIPNEGDETLVGVKLVNDFLLNTINSTKIEIMTQ